METTNTSFIFVFDRWIVCTTASFFCFLLLTSFLSYNQHTFNLTTDIIIADTTTTTTTTTTPPPKEDTIHSQTQPEDTIHPQTKNQTQHKDIIQPQIQIQNKTQPQEKIEMKNKCDIFDGRWVYNKKGRPLYRASRCPFLGPQVNCQKNGRPDYEYEKWRWEAKDCEIPRFNGTDMLERLRGKRVIIVGDSLNRNQFESLSCLLYSSISPKTAIVNVHSDIYKIFTAKDYNCTVEFYWSPFLVELDETSSAKYKLLKVDTLHPSAGKWLGADVMIFNTGHWWVHTGKLQVWDRLQNNGKIIEQLEIEKAFEIAMKAWATWVDTNVDPTKTTVFFRSISPEHKGEQWCYNQTKPIEDESYIPIFPRKIVDIVETTVVEMKTPVRYLNITKLSQYRKDGHPSVYRAKNGQVLNMEQRKHPEVFADCSHWCIPGVPDTWNSLLYASLVLQPSQDVIS